MTNTEMLARCRTLLDEASASMWSDAEIYSALTDGQQEVASYFLNIYKVKKEVNLNAELPSILEPLFMETTSTTVTSGISKPSDYWYLIAARYAYTGGIGGDFYNCRIEKISATAKFNLENTYLTASEINPVIYEAYSGGLLFWFKPNPSETAAYTLSYIKLPAAINSSTQPILSAVSHSAIVHWAVAQMLLKDQRPEEAQLLIQNYIQELQNIGY